MKIAITGASRGIGRTIATTLAAPGRQLHLHARRAESLAEVAAEAQERGAEVTVHGAELSDKEQVRRLAEAFGRLDLLVNNAGVGGHEKYAWETSAEELEETLAVNLIAPLILTSSAIAHAGEDGVRIVDLSSGSAVTDTEKSADYWISKTALMRLGGCIDKAGRDRGIKIFEIAPGVVATDMTAAMRAHDGRTEWTSATEIAAIIEAVATGELDALAGCHMRAGTDSLDDLKARAGRGVGTEERRLRLTPWAEPTS